MEASDQLHTPVALPLGKEAPPIASGEGAGESWSQSGHGCGEKEISLPLSGIKSWPSNPQHSYYTD